MSDGKTLRGRHPAATGAAAPAARAWLVPLSGPPLEPLELLAKPAGTTLGRHEECDVRLLQTEADKVSRLHARFGYDPATRRWRVTDLGSRWGTFLNGAKLVPGPDVPLVEGDLIRITPWTFSFSTAGSRRRGLRAVGDENQMQTLVRAAPTAPVEALADDLLALLLEASAAVHAAADERALADAVLDAAVRGTGLPNAALLRPLDAAGTVEVVAARREGSTGAADVASPVFSRSLLAAASRGVVAELSGPGADNVSASIVQMRIDTAICVPLVLGTGASLAGATGRNADPSATAAPTVAAYLYLDSRSAEHRPPATRLKPNASGFCAALGRMASLALANLKRLDMEHRQALMEVELAAAAAAQRWILPKRHTRAAGFDCTGESRPGAYLGGDFFDLIPLSPTRLAVALGDVTGHGIAASVLMTASQGFLHAALQEHGDVAKAVTDLNAYVHPRRDDQRFVTLWVGLFDAAARTLTYVDAGHGYAMMLAADGATVTPLSGGDGLPIGILADCAYTAEQVPLESGARALVVSDGIPEQYGTARGPAGAATTDHFELAGVHAALTATPSDQDVVAAIFDAVVRHAGTTALQDDATAVLVKW